MLLRTAGSVADVLTLFRLAIFHDIKSTLFNYLVNVCITLLALVLMRHMHTAAYEVFYNFVTGVLNPSILIVMASLTIALLGFEFIFVGVTFYPKGHVPTLMVKLITSIRDSIVVMSGAALALAAVMYGADAGDRIRAIALSVLYFASAYLVAFLCLAPFWLDSRRLTDRISLVLAGAGLIALVWFWPDIFSPQVLNLNSLLD